MMIADQGGLVASSKNAWVNSPTPGKRHERS